MLLDTVPRIGHELDSTSFSFFCDKMARMFVPRFQVCLHASRCGLQVVLWARSNCLAVSTTPGTTRSHNKRGRVRCSV